MNKDRVYQMLAEMPHMHITKGNDKQFSGKWMDMMIELLPVTPKEKKQLLLAYFQDKKISGYLKKKKGYITFKKSSSGDEAYFSKNKPSDSILLPDCWIDNVRFG